MRGFNLIATANDRDRGVNELSSALRRRFNTVVLPLPATAEEEMTIVARRVAELGAALALPEVPAAADEIRRVVTIFRELRDGVTEDGRTSLKTPTGTLSTAEAISVVTNGLALAAHFGDGTLQATDVAGGIVGAVVRDPLHDEVAWREYLETVVRDREGWGDFYDARARRAFDVTAARTCSGSATTGRVRRGRCGGRSTRCGPTSCSSRRRPTPPRRWRGSATPGSSRRSPCSATSSPQPERAVFAPLAAFSPEWQAVLWAAAHGVAVEPIDLPLALTLAEPPDPEALPAGHAPPDPLGDLAAAAGEPDAERWWEDLVEHRGDGEPVFDAVAEAMAATRAGTWTSPHDALREAHMRRRIRAALAAHGRRSPSSAARGTSRRCIRRGHRGRRRRGAARAAQGEGRRHVGAVDAPPAAALDRLRRRRGQPGLVRPRVPPSRPRRRRRASSSTPPTCCAGRGMAASPDHLIAASRLAGSLAALRDRPRPGLAEVLDASDAVLGGLPLVVDELVVGDAVGEVPPDAPQVPLARDLAACQRAARLKPESAPRTIELDLRTPNGLRRSHLLHRLTALGVPWGRLQEGRGSSGTFRETWQVAWEPELSVRLVERAGHGTTVEAAATSCLVEQAAAADPAGRRHRRRRAGPARRPDRRRHAGGAGHRPARRRRARRRRADGHARPAGVGAALRRRAAHRRRRAARRVRRDRARASSPGSAGPPRASRRRGAGDDRADERRPGGARRRSTTRRATPSCPAVLAALADARRVHGLVHGRAVRLLHDGGQWAPADVQARLGRALTPGTPAADGAAFVEGFLAGSGTVLLHDDQLLRRRRRVDRVAARRHVRRCRGPAPAHVRRVRAGRAPPARNPAVDRPGRSDDGDGRRCRHRPRRRRPGHRARHARPMTAFPGHAGRCWPLARWRSLARIVDMSDLA